MNKTQAKTNRRSARRNRIRARAIGSAEKPRLAVFKSNTAIYAQLINDETGTTIAAADSRKLTGKKVVERATAVGTEIAKKATEAGIKSVVFDRGGYRYQGNVAALAEAARAGGLKF